MRAVLTGSFSPERVQISHEYGIINFPEKPLQYICHILYEIVSNAEFHIPGIFAKFLHQKFDSGLGTIFPVYTLMAQTCARQIFIIGDIVDLDEEFPKKLIIGNVYQCVLPYWVIKAMQLSTMMGMSFLLSCWSLRVFPFPPAAFWMSVYHREKSVRPMP